MTTLHLSTYFIFLFMNNILNVYDCEISPVYTIWGTDQSMSVLYSTFNADAEPVNKYAL